MKRVFLIVTITVFLIACGVTATKIVTTNNYKQPKPLVQGTAIADASADYTGYCGQEFANIKQLKDSAANSINFTPQPSTIADLVKLNKGKPNPVTTRNADEKKVVTLKVHLDKMKGESDSDIHVGVSDGNGNTMIVEFIAPQCEGALKATELIQARANLFAECGTPIGSGFSDLSGKTATVTGVVFYDKLHGQFDVAPNGIELHPVLSFSGCNGTPAPPVVTVSTTTTPVTTSIITTVPTPTPVDRGKGCKKYPGKHWYKHVFHKECRFYYYSTP